MKIFSEGITFLTKHPNLFLLHVIGWIPSLVMLFVTLDQQDALLAAYYYNNLALMQEIIVYLLQVFAAVLAVHLLLSTLIVGATALFVKKGLTGKASLRTALRKLKPRYWSLFFAKLSLWIVSLLFSVLFSFFILFARDIASLVSLGFLAVFGFLMVESVISIVNSFLAPAIVLEKRNAIEGLRRAWDITLHQVSLKLVFLFVIANVVGFAIVMLSFTPFVGPLTAQFLNVIVGAYFVVLWLFFYFKFEKKKKLKI